jgi:AraC-like DNA-binding protein
MKPKTNFVRLAIAGGLEILSCDAYKDAFPEHYHEQFVITLVLAGTEQFSTRQSGFYAPTGSISIVHPNEVHSCVSLHATGLSFCTFYVSADFMCWLNNGKMPYFNHRVIEDGFLFDRFYRMRQWLAAQTDAPINAGPLLGLVLHDLIVKYAHDGHLLTDSQQSMRLLTELKHAAECSDTDSFSLEKAALSMGLDKYKFLRLFKQFTGLTPNNYIIFQKVEASKKKLLTASSMIEVAYEMGFYDTSHFYRHFKRFTGVTPLQYRQALLQQ